MRAPLDRFTELRAERVRALRKDGETDLAQRIASLRKPSVVLWALNQSGAVATDDLDALRVAGDVLREAQEQVLGGDRSAASRLQHATQEQRRRVDALSRRLGMVLTGSGHAASDETMRRIGDGLRAASIAAEDTWDALRAGRLLAEPEAPSFPAMDSSRMRRVEEDRAGAGAEAQARRREAAEAEVRRTEQLERAAQEQAESAQRRLEQATRELEGARAALARLRDGGG
jgi:hypothetical protein